MGVQVPLLVWILAAFILQSCSRADLVEHLLFCPLRIDLERASKSGVYKVCRVMLSKGKPGVFLILLAHIQPRMKCYCSSEYFILTDLVAYLHSLSRLRWKHPYYHQLHAQPGLLIASLQCSCLSFPLRCYFSSLWSPLPSVSFRLLS